LNGRDCGGKYRVMFYAPGVASLPRKARRCREPRKQPDHYLDVQAFGTADTVCIEVASGSHQFLAGPGMVPTCSSELCSQYFPAWYLGRHPTHRVLLASYESGFASLWGEKTRDVLVNVGKPIFNLDLQSRRAARGNWRLPQGGGMICTG